jgi:dihydrofolate reductase
LIVSAIAAVAENGVIGRNNGLPWHLTADLRRFKELTLGHTVILGRRTLESIRRPLPGEIFRLAFSRLHRLYLTVVHVSVEGDTTFPELVAEEWRLVEEVRHSADATHPYDYTFLRYERFR